jgi:hypothetical protein
MSEDYIPLENVLSEFRSAVRESYKGREDRAEVGGSRKVISTNYKVIELLSGESRQKWQKEFGDS